MEVSNKVKKLWEALKITAEALGTAGEHQPG